jgi:TPR repeat protein
VGIVARSLAPLLVGLLAFGCATVALAEAETSAEPTDPEAQFELGKRFAFGLEGTKKDQRAALKWFRLAAEQGHPRAQTQLGMAYQRGRGVRRDMQESVGWMRKAADQGNAKAQFELGVAYRDGRGVPKDRVLGLMWLFLSQEKGGIAARLVAPGLARQLKPRDRKEAWELVYQWREAHGLPRIPPRTAKPRLIPRTKRVPKRKAPADSEAAPKPQDGVTPAETPPQERDAPPSA